ncbi:MAG: chorismate mutase [Clostridiales bacterium]|nr:chorismate mutase [Clostridiales bacterium]
MSISEARKEIDALDEQIIALLEKRMALAVLIGKEKKAAGKPLRDEAREDEILRRIEKLADRPYDTAIQSVYDTLFSECVKLER